MVRNHQPVSILLLKYIGHEVRARNLRAVLQSVADCFLADDPGHVSVDMNLCINGYN